jgi:tellurite resistance protein TehA-like permease
MSTRLQAAPDAAFGGWLMPVVPPMVSAATGALLVPHLPAGQLRLTMLLACYAMFGLSLIASLVVITQLWRRLVRYSVGPVAMVPTLWIVLGPLGQSITAVNLLGGGPTWPFRSPTAPRSRRSASSTASRCGASPRCGQAWRRR